MARLPPSASCAWRLPGETANRCEVSPRGHGRAPKDENPFDGRCDATCRTSGGGHAPAAVRIVQIAAISCQLPHQLRYATLAGLIGTGRTLIPHDERGPPFMPFFPPPESRGSWAFPRGGSHRQLSHSPGLAHQSRNTQCRPAGDTSPENAAPPLACAGIHRFGNRIRRFGCQTGIIGTECPGGATPHPWTTQCHANLPR